MTSRPKPHIWTIDYPAFSKAGSVHSSLPDMSMFVAPRLVASVLGHFAHVAEASEWADAPRLSSGDGSRPVSDWVLNTTLIHLVQY